MALNSMFKLFGLAVEDVWYVATLLCDIEKKENRTCETVIFFLTIGPQNLKISLDICLVGVSSTNS